MATPQVNYQAGFLPQGAYDQINRNIAQGGQGLLQTMLAKQEREMKTLEQFGQAVGGMVNKSREDKKLARDNAKEIYDRDMELARKELDSFKVGSPGYQKASEKIKEMQAKRDSALQAFDDQGFFSRDDSVLNIGPEKKEIREDRLADAQKYYANAEKSYSEQRPIQDEMSALRSAGGYIAKGFALNQKRIKENIQGSKEADKGTTREIQDLINASAKLTEEQKTLKGPQDSLRVKEIAEEQKKLKKQIKQKEQSLKQSEDYQKAQENRGRFLETRKDRGLLGLNLEEQQRKFAQKENQVSEALTKATLAENDTSVPEGKFRSALTGELYDTADLKVDEARDFQININKENEKQRDEDKAFGLQLKAISEIQDPKDYETEINKIPDEKLSRDVKDSMILAHRQGFKTNSIDNVLKLKSVYGGDQKGFFNHVKNAVDADGNKLFPGFEGITYTDTAEKSLTQTLVIRAANTGALTNEQRMNYESQGIINKDQSEALKLINDEASFEKETKTDNEKRALKIRAASVMGGQTLINAYISEGILPAGTQFDESEKAQEKLQGYKMMAVNALVKQGDLVQVEKFLKSDEMNFIPSDLKDSIYQQAVNENQVLEEAKALVQTQQGRADERLKMALESHSNAQNAEQRSQAMHDLRKQIMNAAEARAVDAEGDRKLAALRASERFDRENENRLYQIIRDSAGPGEALAYMKSVRPGLKNIDFTDFEKLERSTRFKVDSGQGTITQEEADAYGVDLKSLQAQQKINSDNVEKQNLTEKLLRGTKFEGADADAEARLLGFNSAQEANDYIKFERNGLITKRLTALGNNYREIEELQKAVGANTGGVDFKTRVREAKESKAQEKVDNLFGNLYKTAHIGATNLVDSTFDTMVNQDFEFKELQKQGFIKGDVVNKLKKSFKEVEKIKHDKVLVDRRTQGISEVESYLSQWHGANDEGKKQLEANMKRVNNEKMLGFDIDSLITTQTASTKLKLAKDRAIAEKAIIEARRSAIAEANDIKTRNGELTTADIKRITSNLVQAKLRNPYDPKIDASEIVKGVDSIKSILNIFAQTGKVEFDETELDEEP